MISEPHRFVFMSFDYSEKCFRAFKDCSSLKFRGLNSYIELQTFFLKSPCKMLLNDKNTFMLVPKVNFCC